MSSTCLNWSRKTLGILAGALLLSLNAMGTAQDAGGARPTLPQGALLKSPPHFSQWVVTFSYPQDRASSDQGGKAVAMDPILPRKIVTTVTDKIIREEIQTVGGSKIDRYQVGRIIYSKIPNVAFWTMFNPDEQRNTSAQDRSLSPLPENGFRGLDWISDKTYAGTLDQGKLSYLVFVPSYVSDVDLKNTAAVQALPIFAYVDANTRLPSTVGENAIIRTYSFLSPPTAVQTLPEDLMKDIKDAEAIRAKFNVAPQKEY